MSVAAGAVGTLVGSDRALCPVPGRLTSGRSASAARAPSTRSGPARRTRCTGSRENQRQRGAGGAPSGNRSSTRVPISPSSGSHSHTAGQASHAAALRRGGPAGTDPPQSRSSARSTRSPTPAVASPRRCPGGAGLAGPDDREARRHQGQRGRGGDGRRPGGVQDRHDRDADTSGQVLTSSPTPPSGSPRPRARPPTDGQSAASHLPSQRDTPAQPANDARVDNDQGAVKTGWRTTGPAAERPVTPGGHPARSVISDARTGRAATVPAGDGPGCPGARLEDAAEGVGLLEDVQADEDIDGGNDLVSPAPHGIGDAVMEDQPPPGQAPHRGTGGEHHGRDRRGWWRRPGCRRPGRHRRWHGDPGDPG